VRIDYREKEQRKKEKTMEFIWKPYEGIEKSIFTHITFGHYNPPDSMNGMIYGSKSSPSSYDDTSIYNEFVKIADAYRTNDILFLYGDDFAFQEVDRCFNNIEAMMKAFKDDPYYDDKINFFYSTPSKYFNAIRSSGVEFPHHTEIDFFPYSDMKLDYWTGFFTSRPYLKGISRDARIYINTASELLINHLMSNRIGVDVKAYIDSLYSIKKEQSIAQHHDGVTGTGREEVSKDYIDRLRNGIVEVSKSIRELVEDEISVLKGREFVTVCYEAVAFKDCINKVYTTADIKKGLFFVLINQKLDRYTPIKI
jgi:hypothetical protein